VKGLIFLLLQWVDEAGGMETLGKVLLRRKKTQEVPQFTAPEVKMLTDFSMISLSLKTFKLWLHLRLTDDIV